MAAKRVTFYQTGSFTVGNRLLDPAMRAVQADGARTNAITSGHRACQGCGEALGARYVLDAAMRVTGGNLVTVNATGCLEVFSTPYPESAWQVAWLHSLFGNAPAVAAGVAAALRAKGRDDIRVIGQAGDGGTVDIGFGCLSGLFERNDDVLFVCYDNQGYMNTGVQRSGATPPAARTSTTPVVAGAPGNRFGQGKFAPLIAMAHGIPYVATATVADLHDLESKVERAMQLRGARYLHVLVPCPLGWGTAASETVRVARLATESGFFPVFEAEDGEVTGVSPIRHRVPVEEYLRLQARYRHLFEPTRNEDLIASIQAGADRTIRRFGLVDDGVVMDEPFAITLPPASSRGNRTGAWRTERPVYVDLLPPCNNACPAGENIQRWLSHAQERDYEAAWRELMRDNPFPAIMGRVCYHPCQTACNRATLDEAVGINAIERFLGDEALRRGWTVQPSAPPSGRRVLVVGAGPAGLSAAYHLRLLGHEVTVRDASAQAGGMMRYGIPAYRLPRDVLDLEVARLVELGIVLELGRAVDDLQADLTGGGFDAAFLAIGAQIGKRAYLPAGDSARILDALGVLRSVADGGTPSLGRRVVVYGGGNTAMDVARTARRLGATDTLVVYRRTRERMPAADVEVEEALAEGVRLRWLSTIAYAGGDTVRVERMRLDEQGRPQPTGEFEELPADSVVLAIGQDVDQSMVSHVDGIGVVDGVVQVGPDLMTGRAGVFAGGDVTTNDRTVTSAVGQGKRAARHIDGWLRGQAYAAPLPGRLATADRLHPWYYSEAPATVRPQLDAARRASTFDEVVQGLDEDTALFEARRCLSCGNCFECDNCYGMCPDNAVIKLGPGQRFAIDLDYCKGCGICAAECPCGAIDMVPEQT